MNFKYTTIVFSLLFIILQGCSSIELTQSRYGNGLGVSFTKGGTKEELKAEAFRNRNHDEIHDKKYQVNPKQRELKTLPTEQVVMESPLALNNNGALIEANIKISKNEGITSSVNHLQNPLPKNGNKLVEMPKGQQNAAEPAEVQQTQGGLSNLGYLGGVLVIVGLIFILLAIPSGYPLVVLGVVLIIIAYFFG